MKQFLDPDPTAEFPYTVFDPETGEVLDRVDHYGLATKVYPGTVIIKTA